MGENGFYRAFEDRHRGSRESIIRRLAVYLPFVKPLLTIYPEPTAVDLGCGRGEWLELMGQNGFNAVGADIDEGMLSACAERDLKAVKQDASTFLKTLARESQCVVSGFHIAEHMPFSDLRILVEEALRVLKPGGLLILETPNPENVAVGTTNFYLDPTHQRPIPPLLLEFLPEYYGFERVKILRLQESRELVGKERVDLIDVFCGASPDYAVVAQKTAVSEALAVFDEIFAQPHGIELGELANRFDAKLDRRFGAVEQRIANAENLAGETERVLDRFASLHERLLAEAVRAERTRATTALLAEQLYSANSRLRAVERELAVVKDHAEQFESRTTAAESCIGELEARLVAADERAEALERRAISAETRVGELQAERDELERAVVAAQGSAHFWHTESERWHARLSSVHCSNSWRITAPIRVVKRIATGDFSPVGRATGLIRRGVRRALRPPAVAAARAALSQPGLRLRVGAILRKYPRIRDHVVLFVRNAGLVPGSTVPIGEEPLKANYSLGSPDSLRSITNVEPDLSSLPVNARKLYHDLQAVVRRNGRGGE